MGAPMISVIIPVYNTEKYIVDCLDSLVRQTYQDFEVLLINDGSTDASAQIITNYIAENNLEHFHLIHKENGGVSTARNLGIEKAAGKWIAFIDSDDWVEPEYLQRMVEGLQEHPADFCMTGFRRYYEENDSLRDSHNVSFDYGNTDDKLAKIILNHPIGRLFSREVLSENNIHFDTSILFAEDTAFMFDYIRHTMKVLILPENQYVYRIRSGSLTTSIVRPHQKKGLSEHALTFWKAYEKQAVIQRAFAGSYHIAHSILDSFLTDIICAVLDHDTEQYTAIANHPVAHYAVKHYRHAESSRRERVLVLLLKYRLHFAVKALIKLYYSDSLNKTIRKLLKKDRK